VNERDPCIHTAFSSTFTLHAHSSKIKLMAPVRPSGLCRWQRLGIINFFEKVLGEHKEQIS